MKKLIILDTINFTDDVKNIHDNSLWVGRQHGLYEVSCMIGNLRHRFLVTWGIDSNFPNQSPIVFSMPLPTVDVFEKVQENQIIEKPMQLLESEGTSITGDVLLKAIAIAQNPELSLKLLNQ